MHVLRGVDVSDVLVNSVLEDSVRVLRYPILIGHTVPTVQLRVCRCGGSMSIEGIEVIERGNIGNRERE